MTENADQRSDLGKFRNPPWWNRRTRLERTLCFIAVTSLLIVAIMGAILTTFGYLYQKNIDSRQLVSQNSLCLTPGCVKAAAEILLNIDETVDPCDDFYYFACGGWIKRQNIKEDRAKVSTFIELRDDISLKLRGFLEQNLDGSEPEFIKMLKLLYDTCLDLKSIEKSGADPLKNILKRLGGWPVVEGDKWEDWNFDWVDMLKFLRKLGYDHDILLSLSVESDMKNNTVNVLTIDEPSIGLDRSYFLNGLNDSITSAYFKRMVKSAMLLGADEVTAKNELLEALHFITALANFSLPEEEKRNISKFYNKFTIKKLQQEVPQIPWLKYINNLLNDEVYENETVIVAVPDFLPKLADLIASTDKRVLANYMIWTVVYTSAYELSKDWRDLYLEYIFRITGTSQEKPRWEYCQGLVIDWLGIGLGAYYVRHYFSEESKDAVLELVRYIHKEFLNILEEVDWMGDQTKEQAKEKANTMKTYIGYPKELFNTTAVLEYYQNLTITNESFFENMRRLNVWLNDYSMSQLRKPNIKGDWKNRDLPTTVNAFDIMNENSIEFPAGILQNPLFNKDRPQYMNFGAIGSIIGHEITHNFDDKGRQFDKDGNSVNWWDERTDEFFKKKAQCIIDLFSNYTVDGLNVNGVITQGENIADLGGLKEAYRAYQSWVKDHGEEQLLPSLKFTQNQLFWISAARVSCEKYRPEELKLNMLKREHCPERFKVIGPMSNLPEFAKEFNCPLGSPMNKKEKCQVW